MLFAAAGCFCLLCGYYMLRPMREALALEVGVHNNSILFSIGARVCPAALLPDLLVAGAAHAARPAAVVVV